MSTVETAEMLHLRDRIMELVEELGAERNLVFAMRAHIEKADQQLERSNETIRRWIESFEMSLTDEGCAWMDDLIRRYNHLLNEHNKLVRKWNRYVGSFNARHAIGRPLRASKAQQAQVRRLRKAGNTLREIAHETNLSFQTIRTIIGHKHDSGRTTKKKNELRKIELNSYRTILWRAKDALHTQINAMLKDGEDLVKEGQDLLKK
jgi:Helix-turn-helix domain of resolvase